jgi:hypothetical protein
MTASSIVVLSDVIFPKAVIVAGTSGVLSRQNARSANQGGYARVNVIRDVTMRAWQVGTGPMTLTAANQLFGTAEVTDFGAFGMLMEDPIGSSVDATNGALMGYMLGVESGVVGFGNGCPTYGLRQVYTAMGSTQKRARALTRPNGAPVIKRGGSTVTVGVAAGNIALSAAPVYVTFVADASQNVTSITPGVTTSVTLAAALPGLVVGGKLWLQDLNGADQAAVNSQSHTITAITGGGLNVYTLSTNTTGKIITAAGTGKKYPQPDEALTVACNYYVPVHFRADTIDWDLVISGAIGKRMVVVPSTYLDEVREA